MTGSLHILLAEDDPLAADALRALLAALGHRVVGPARDGEQAVELARGHRVDLAVLDIRMPRLSGFEAARAIFDLRPLPIIFLTGHSDPRFIEEVVTTPVHHYLIKPVGLEDLGPAIEVAHVRFHEWLRFRDESAALERKLEERQVIDRAKAVLMQARDCSEDEAYHLLRRESQNRNQSMAEIARTVLAAHSLLGSA